MNSNWRRTEKSCPVRSEAADDLLGYLREEGAMNTSLVA